MPTFQPGEGKIAAVAVTVVPSGMASQIEVFLGPDENTKVASGIVDFVSNGESQEVVVGITMPTAPGTYNVYLDLYGEGSVIAKYQAESVTIQEMVQNLVPYVSFAACHWLCYHEDRCHSLDPPIFGAMGLQQLLISFENYSYWNGEWGNWAPIKYRLTYDGPVSPSSYPIPAMGFSYSGNAAAASFFGYSGMVRVECFPGEHTTKVTLEIFHPESGELLKTQSFYPDIASRTPSDRVVTVLDDPYCGCDEGTIFVADDNLYECQGGDYVVVFTNLGLGVCGWDNPDELKIGNDGRRYQCTQMHYGWAWYPQFSL